MDAKRQRINHPLEERYLAAIRALDHIMDYYRVSLIEERETLSEKEKAEAMSLLNGVAVIHQDLTKQRITLTANYDSMLEEKQKAVGA